MAKGTTYWVIAPNPVVVYPNSSTAAAAATAAGIVVAHTQKSTARVAYIETSQFQGTVIRPANDNEWQSLPCAIGARGKRKNLEGNKECQRLNQSTSSSKTWQNSLTMRYLPIKGSAMNMGILHQRLMP